MRFEQVGLLEFLQLPYARRFQSYANWYFRKKVDGETCISNRRFCKSWKAAASALLFSCWNGKDNLCHQHRTSLVQKQVRASLAPAEECPEAVGVDLKLSCGKWCHWASVPAKMLTTRVESSGESASALGFLGGMAVVPKHEVYPWMKYSIPCAKEFSFKSFTCEAAAQWSGCLWSFQMSSGVEL